MNEMALVIAGPTGGKGGKMELMDGVDMGMEYGIGTWAIQSLVNLGWDFAFHLVRICFTSCLIRAYRYSTTVLFRSSYLVMQPMFFPFSPSHFRT